MHGLHEECRSEEESGEETLGEAAQKETVYQKKEDRSRISETRFT